MFFFESLIQMKRNKAKSNETKQSKDTFNKKKYIKRMVYTPTARACNGSVCACDGIDDIL